MQRCASPQSALRSDNASSTLSTEGSISAGGICSADSELLLSELSGKSQSPVVKP